MQARSNAKLLVATLLLVAAGQPAAAQKGEKPERALPEVFTKVVECRTIADNAERLACFDRAVGALAEAQETKEVRVVSRDDVNRTRRNLFGFVTSGFGLFGAEDEEEEQEELKEINATIASFSGSSGAYVFTLDDGSVWEQSDSSFLKKPKEGQPIRIRRAFLSSYMANIDGGIGFRIKRRR